MKIEEQLSGWIIQHTSYSLRNNTDMFNEILLNSGKASGFVIVLDALISNASQILMVNVSRKWYAGLACVIEYLDSEQFLGEAAKWSAIALQMTTVPLIIKGFVAQTGLPLVMTLPTCSLFVFRSRYGCKKRLLTNKSDYISLIVWGILLAQSLAFNGSLL